MSSYVSTARITFRSAGTDESVTGDGGGSGGSGVTWVVPSHHDDDVPQGDPYSAAETSSDGLSSPTSSSQWSVESGYHGGGGHSQINGGITNTGTQGYLVNGNHGIQEEEEEEAAADQATSLEKEEVQQQQELEEEVLERETAASNLYTAPTTNAQSNYDLDPMPVETGVHEKQGDSLGKTSYCEELIQLDEEIAEYQKNAASGGAARPTDGYNSSPVSISTMSDFSEGKFESYYGCKYEDVVVSSPTCTSGDEEKYRFSWDLKSDENYRAEVQGHFRYNNTPASIAAGLTSSIAVERQKVKTRKSRRASISSSDESDLDFTWTLDGKEGEGRNNQCSVYDPIPSQASLNNQPAAKHATAKMSRVDQRQSTDSDTLESSDDNQSGYTWNPGTGKVSKATRKKKKYSVMNLTDTVTETDSDNIEPKIIPQKNIPETDGDKNDRFLQRLIQIESEKEDKPEVDESVPWKLYSEDLNTSSGSSLLVDFIIGNQNELNRSDSVPSGNSHMRDGQPNSVMDVWNIPNTDTSNLQQPILPVGTPQSEGSPMETMRWFEEEEGEEEGRSDEELSALVLSLEPQSTKDRTLEPASSSDIIFSSPYYPSSSRAPLASHYGTYIMQYYIQAS